MVISINLGFTKSCHLPNSLFRWGWEKRLLSYLTLQILELWPLTYHSHGEHSITVLLYPEHPIFYNKNKFKKLMYTLLCFTKFAAHCERTAFEPTVSCYTEQFFHTEGGQFKSTTMTALN